MSTGDSNCKFGPLRTVSYHVQSLLDLQDVLEAINRLISAKASKYEIGAVKRTCNITAIPLKNRISGMILKITLPAEFVVEGYCRESTDTNADS